MEKKRPPPFFLSLTHTHTHTHTYTHIPQAQRSKGAAASISNGSVCASLKKRVSGGVREVADFIFTFFLFSGLKEWERVGRQGEARQLFCCWRTLVNWGIFEKTFQIEFWGFVGVHYCLIVWETMCVCACLRGLNILSRSPVTYFSMLTEHHRIEHFFPLGLEKKKEIPSDEGRIDFCCCCAISGCWSVKAGWDWPQVTGHQNRLWSWEMDGWFRNNMLRWTL